MNTLKQHGFFYGALLYAFCIPFPQKIINIVLMVWVVLSLLGSNKSTFVTNRYLWLLPVFYLLYFIGFFSSETMSFKFLEYKLSLLIFPLLFFLHSYNEKQRNTILKFFIWGLGASIVGCLAIAFCNSLGTENGNLIFQPNVLEGKGFMESILYGGNYFFGRYLSVFHQTVYYAMYLCAGVAVLFFRPQLFSEKLRTGFLTAFLIMLFLVSNKASFIVLAMIVVIKLWAWKVAKNKKVIGFSVFVCLLLAFVLFNPRIKGSIVSIAEGNLKIEKEARFGFSTRLLSWDSAISLIAERPILGYGHASTQNALNKKYAEKGYSSPLKESYNAHNLWLQSWLENGILAVLLLISIFGVLFQKSQYGPLFVAFVVVLLVNSMFEGMFNRFSGISFFSFLVCFVITTARGGLAKP